MWCRAPTPLGGPVSGDTALAALVVLALAGWCAVEILAALGGLGTRVAHLEQHTFDLADEVRALRTWLELADSDEPVDEDHFDPEEPYA